MRVAITMNVVEAYEYFETRDAISHEWQNWLNVQDVEMIAVPNLSRKSDNYLGNIGADVLILSGGNDVVPRYGDLKYAEKKRTETENFLLQEAVRREIPVFGICRGFHIINIFFGGTITPDVKNAPGFNNHSNETHPIKLSETFAKIAGSEKIEVNSYHNQGIQADQVADNLSIIAFHPGDNLVEGLAHSSLPILAIQWHPERNIPHHSFDTDIFKSLCFKGNFWDLG